MDQPVDGGRGEAEVERGRASRGGGADEGGGEPGLPQDGVDLLQGRLHRARLTGTGESQEKKAERLGAGPRPLTLEQVLDVVQEQVHEELLVVVAKGVPAEAELRDLLLAAGFQGFLSVCLSVQLVAGKSLLLCLWLLGLLLCFWLLALNDWLQRCT